MRPKRIGMLRIAQESNAYSPILSELSDFQHDLQGDELMSRTGRGQFEVKGFMRNAELSGFRKAVRRRAGFEVVPLFSVWALPSGPLSKKALASIRERLQRALEEAGPLDGLFVSLHGAMVGEGGTRPETILLADLREALGNEIPIAATVDLHAHLTKDFMQHLTVIAAYRTNPHRDHAACGFRCGKMLLDILDGTLIPTMAWRHLPMVTGGGTTIDFLPTMRPIFRQMTKMERDPTVRYVSLLMCHLWLDSPDLGWSVAVVTNNDQAKADILAQTLADTAWAVRHKKPPEMSRPLEAIEKARSATFRRKLGTVCMADASDLVGAGAPGDNTRLIKSLIEHAKDLVCYAAIRHPSVVNTYFDQELGSIVNTEIGGYHKGSSPALAIEGVLIHSSKHELYGRRIVVQIGRMKLVITEDVPFVTAPQFYHSLKMSPLAADICVVKTLFPFRLYFAAYNRLTLYVVTEGATDFTIYERQQFSLPTHPIDEVADWREADRIRRVEG